MIRTLILVLISVFLLSCSSTKNVNEDNNLDAKLHGLWAELYTEDGEILSYVYYLPEGKFHAFGYIEENKNEFWFAFGDWKMLADQSCIKFLFDTYGIMNPNEEMCVTVVSVTDDTFIYMDKDTGQTQTLKRVSNGRLHQK